jgi:transmembrane sensor
MEEKLPKYFSGELEQSDISKLLNEVGNDELLQKEFVGMQNVHALIQLPQLPNDEQEGRRGFQLFMQLLKRRERQQVVWRTMQYAAVALVLIASTFFATRYFLVGSDGEMEPNRLVVPAGQRAQLTLPDGTLVWLNAQSSLTFPARFHGKTRRVSVSGEAYFDVASNSRKPFIVSTQEMEMRVLGTEFNVYSYPEADYIRTDLVEGSLMVYSKRSPQTRVTLKPNEQVVMREGKMYVRKINSPDYFLWKDGIYSFENERLIDIIEKLQLYYDVKIIVKDPEIFNVRYTGKFRQRDGIDEILRIIQKIQKFTIEKERKTNTITLKR